MNEVLNRLRSPVSVFYTYAADYSALLKEAADEIERLQARVQELEAAHDKNIRKAYSTRQLVGKGHPCMWREAAEAMEQRARAALAAVNAEEDGEP